MGGIVPPFAHDTTLIVIRCHNGVPVLARVRFRSAVLARKHSPSTLSVEIGLPCVETVFQLWERASLGEAEISELPNGRVSSSPTGGI